MKLTVAFFKEVQINLQAAVKKVSNRRIIIVHFSIMIKTIKDNTVSRLNSGYNLLLQSALTFIFFSSVVKA